MEQVILVNEEDQVIGTMEKMEAHLQGVLHRAFSILVFNSKGEMLIQKRAKTKYHSGGLWTNACCSHPHPEEDINKTIRKRLKHEMGIDAQSEFLYKFTYKTKLDQNLTEYEVDYVFKAICDQEPILNPQEVDDWKLIYPFELKKLIDTKPEEFTYWFKLIVRELA